CRGRRGSRSPPALQAPPPALQAPPPLQAHAERPRRLVHPDGVRIVGEEGERALGYRGPRDGAPGGPPHPADVEGDPAVAHQFDGAAGADVVEALGGVGDEGGRDGGAGGGGPSGARPVPLARGRGGSRGARKAGLTGRPVPGGDGPVVDWCGRGGRGGGPRRGGGRWRWRGGGGAAGGDGRPGARDDRSRGEAGRSSIGAGGPKARRRRSSRHASYAAEYRANAARYASSAACNASSPASRHHRSAAASPLAACSIRRHGPSAVAGSAGSRLGAASPPRSLIVASWGSEKAERAGESGGRRLPWGSNIRRPSRETKPHPVPGEARRRRAAVTSDRPPQAEPRRSPRVGVGS